MNLFAINAGAINGSGSETLHAFGAMAIDLACASAGQMAQLGSGNVAADLAVTGTGTLAHLGLGDVVIDTALAGSWVQNVLGLGAIDLQISIAGRAATVTNGAGDMPISLTGRYDLPAVQPIPPTYSSAPTSRLMVATGDNRIMKIAADSTFRIEREMRKLTIDHEGRRA